MRAVLALLLLAGCAAAPARPVESAHPRPVDSTRPAEPVDDDDAIRLAVYRYQVGDNASGGQSSVPFVCLEVVEGRQSRDPSPAIMAAMAGQAPRVVPASACDPNQGQGVILEGGNPQEHGLIFRTGEIKVSGDTATVEGGYYAAGLSASGNTYTLERQPDGSWKVTRDQMNWIS